MTRQIVTEIVGDASKFSRATTEATGSADKMAGSFKSSAVAGAAAGVAMSVVTKGIDFVTDALSGASQAAKDDTLSQDRLRLAYENTGQAQSMSVDAIEELIAANQRKGVSDSEQRAGISDFLDITKSATDAMKLNQATVELAAAKGIAYADAEAAIKSAAAGKTAALAKAGVEIAKGASITDIATAVNDKFAGSLDTMAETQSGKGTIANEKLGEAMESVGRIINDLAIVVVPALTGAFADFTTFLTTNVGPAIDFVSKNMDIFGPILAAAAIVIASILVPAFIAWATAAGAAAVATLAAAAPFIAVGLAIAGVVLILNKLGVIQWLIDRFNEIAKVVGPVVADTVAKMGAGFDWLSKNVFPPVVKAVGQVISVIDKVARAVIPPLLGVLDVLGNVAKVVFYGLAVVVQAAFKTVSDVVAAILPPFNAVASVFSSVVSTIAGAVGRLVGIFQNLVGRIAGPLGRLFSPIWEGFKSAINAIVRGWNSLKFTFPDIDMGPLGHVGGFTIGTPNIPYLHTGGIVPGAPGSDVLAMLQAGERVLPRNAAGGPTIIVNINGGLIDGPTIDVLTNALARRLRFTTGT